MRKFGYEVFDGITGTVVSGSSATSCGSDWHAEHDRARLAACRACLASDWAACSFSGTSVPVSKYIWSGVWPLNAECGICSLCCWT